MLSTLENAGQMCHPGSGDRRGRRHPERVSSWSNHRVVTHPYCETIYTILLLRIEDVTSTSSTITVGPPARERIRPKIGLALQSCRPVLRAHTRLCHG